MPFFLMVDSVGSGFSISVPDPVFLEAGIRVILDLDPNLSDSITIKEESEKTYIRIRLVSMSPEQGSGKKKIWSAESLDQILFHLPIGFSSPVSF